MTTIRPLPPAGVSLIYRITRWAAYLGLRLFYRRLDAIEPRNFPADGPVVLAANHPNYIIDALAIATRTGRQIHFVAKGPLLDRYPVLSPFLRRLGVIPIYRAEDDPAGRHDNRSSYEHCAALLQRGGVICMFAEGRSHPEPRLRDLRTGTARIVLESEARDGYRLGVQLIPVGLYFPQEDRYFTDGVVVFGEPIPLDPFLAQHRQHAGKAVRALTGEIQERLRALTLHVPDPGWFEFVEQMHDLQYPANGSALDQLQRSQRVSAAVERFRADRPVQAEQFRARVGRLWHRREAYRRHRLPAADPVAHRRGLTHRLRDGAAIPIASLGFLYHATPFLVPKLWARFLVPSREKKAFVKFLVGVPVFLAWYGATLRLFWPGNGRRALLLLAFGPLSGLLALRSRAHRRRWFDAWRRIDTTSDAELGSTIAAERQALLDEFAPWGESASPSPRPANPTTAPIPHRE